MQSILCNMFRVKRAPGRAVSRAGARRFARRGAAPRSLIDITLSSPLPQNDSVLY
jgi:hypothetical protein